MTWIASFARESTGFSVKRYAFDLMHACSSYISDRIKDSSIRCVRVGPAGKREWSTGLGYRVSWAGWADFDAAPLKEKRERGGAAGPSQVGSVGRKEGKKGAGRVLYSEEDTAVAIRTNRYISLLIPQFPNMCGTHYEVTEDMKPH